MEIYRAEYLNADGHKATLYFKARGCGQAARYANSKKALKAAKDQAGSLRKHELSGVQFIGNLFN